MGTDPLERQPLPRSKSGADREMITVQAIRDMSRDRYVLAREWATEGACYGRLDLNFFPRNLNPSTVNPLKSLCADCSVRTECLGFALITKQQGGIWGGRTDQERARILSRLRRAGGIRTR